MVVDPISLAVFGGTAAYMYEVHRRVQDDRDERQSSTSDDPMRNEGGYNSFHDYDTDRPTGREAEDLNTDDLENYR